MASVSTYSSEQAPILACTISRDVQNFDLLIDDMEAELGESWGDLSFDDALIFFGQPEAADLEFVALAVNADDESLLARITEIIRGAKARGIKVILIADQVGPIVLHQLLKLGAEDFVPYPLPDGALAEAITRIRTPAPAPVAAPVAAAIPAAARAAENDDDDAFSETAAAPKFKAKGDRVGVVLPVHSLAGGAGASTFAVNLAWELATISKTDAPRVCILDLDFQYGAVATYLDLPRKEAVFEVLTDMASADSDSFLQSMLTFNDRLHAFTAPADMLPLDIVGPEDVGRLVDMAAANFDYVVIDMPKTIVAWTEAVLNRAHLYFAMMELDLRSAQNVLRLIRALKAESLPHEKLRHVLNRAPKFTDLTGKARVKKMAESLDISIEVQLPDGGADVTQANDRGLPLSESAPKNALRKEIQKLAKSLHDLNKGVAVAKK